MPEETKFQTLAFIDMPNIVEVREAFGEETARAFLAKSNQSLDSVRQVHGGTLVRSVGSTMLLAFDRVEDAVRAASEIQSVADLWDSELPAPVFRIGVHCGEVSIRNGSVVGDAVSASARLVTNAKPGQTLCSSAVAERVPPSLRMQLMELAMDEVISQRFDGRLYEVIWQSEDEAGEKQPTGSEEGDRKAIQLDIDTVKTLTAPLALDGGQERRKIKLTHMHRKTGEAAQEAVIPEPDVTARKEDTARLCLVWERHVFVVDARKRAATLGRAASNDISFHLDTASRQHAHVEWRDGEFYLVDHSWNGTYLYDDDGFETVVHNDEVKLTGGGLICPGCPGNSAEVVAIRFIEAG